MIALPSGAGVCDNGAMKEPLAYLDGKWIPASQAAISPTDAGFVQGSTVAEQLRTFGGRLFRLADHLARLRRSLSIIGVDAGISDEELARVAQELVRQNHQLLEDGDDLGLSIFVTPGEYASYRAEAAPSRPLLCLHTYPLPFRLWAEKYRLGPGPEDDRHPAGARLLLAVGTEVPQPHALPPGRHPGGRGRARRSGPAAGRTGPGERDLQRQPADLHGRRGRRG